MFFIELGVVNSTNKGYGFQPAVAIQTNNELIWLKSYVEDEADSLKGSFTTLTSHRTLDVTFGRHPTY